MYLVRGGACPGWPWLGEELWVEPRHVPNSTSVDGLPNEIGDVEERGHS